MSSFADFVIVGAGIVGLSLASELRARQPDASIIVLEKESGVGMHASGRNSGVLHSGIFYAEDSLKARVCARGGKAMAAYCDERRLPIARTGKVILPASPGDDGRLKLLFERGKKIGINAAMVDNQDLKSIEPHASSITGKAIHLPDVAVVEPKEIMASLAKDLAEKKIDIRFGQTIEEVNLNHISLKVNGDTIKYGHVFNAAGLHADEVAKAFGCGKQYSILPFKGIYYRVSPDSGLKINGLIYALPDPAVPFLGIHFMKKVSGDFYAGPTVIPAFGRENYKGMEKLAPAEAGGILVELARLFAANRRGFRKLVKKEAFRFLKRRFFQGAHALVPDLRMEDLAPSDKVGIRAQLVDTLKNELVMDFLVERGPRSTHVLNAVSPAFTSAFAFAEVVLDDLGIR